MAAIDNPDEKELPLPLSSSSSSPVKDESDIKDGGIHLAWKELYEDLNVREYYPVKEFSEYLEHLCDGNHLVRSLDFSGIELLTDEVFFALKELCEEKRSLSESVFTLKCIGCVYLTDLSMLYVASALPNLKKIYFDGCYLITDAGIRHLKTISSSLKFVSLISTAICRQPEWQTDTTFDLLGCHLDTSAVTTDMQPSYKMVMISGEKQKQQLLTFLLSGNEGNINQSDDALQFFPGVTFDGVDNVFNVFQCHCKPAMLSPFISPRAIYFIVIDLEDDTENPQLDMMSSISAVRGQVRQSVFNVVLLHRDTATAERNAQADDMGKELERYLQKQTEALRKHVQLVAYNSGKSCRQDFQTQQRFSRSSQALAYKNTFHLYRINVDTAEIALHWPKHVNQDKLDSLKKELDGLLHDWIRDFELAKDSLQSCNKADISELMSYSSAPQNLIEIFKAMFILKDIRLEKNETVWSSRRKLIGNYRFLQELLSYDPSTVTMAMVEKLEPILENPELTIEKIVSVSRMGAAFYHWIQAMYKYGKNIAAKALLWKNMTEQKDSGNIVAQAEQGPSMLLRQLSKSTVELDTMYADYHSTQITAELARYFDERSSTKVHLLRDVHKEFMSGEIGLKVLHSAVDRLQIQGGLLFFPELTGQPIVADISWFMHLLSTLPVHQGQNADLKNGGRYKALPPSIPILDHASICSMWQDEGTLLDVVIAILRHFAILIPVPRRPSTSQQRNPLDTHLILFAHINERIFIRATADSGIEKSSYFARHFWRDFNTKRDHQEDAQIQYNYSMTVGCPASLLPRIFAECSQVAPVMLMCLWSMILRHGSAEVYIRHNVHSTTLSSSIDVSARVTNFGCDEEERVIQNYLWSVIHPYLLLVEYHINQYPGLHVAIEVPCQGSCIKQGIPRTFKVVQLPQKLVTKLECSGCGDNGMTAQQVRFLIGRVSSMNSHDYRPVHSVVSPENSIAPYSSECIRHIDTPDSSLWVCNHCGIYKNGAVRLRDMENTLYPSAAVNAFEVRKSSTKDETAALKGNIVTIDEGAGRQVALCTEPLYTGLAVHACMLTEGTAKIVVSYEHYLTHDIFEDEHLSQSFFHFDLQSGLLTENGTSVMTEKIQVGDRVSVKMEREVLVREEHSQDIKLRLSIAKNSQTIHHTFVPYRSHVAIVQDETAGQPCAKLLTECPLYTMLRASHFPLGSALLYLTDIGNQWAVGQVLATQGGLLEVGDSTTSKWLRPNCKEILPLSHYSEGITVVIDKEILKSKDQLLSYLRKSGALPTPFGLFPHVHNSKMPFTIRLLPYQPIRCTVSPDSPEALLRAFIMSLSQKQQRSKKRSSKDLFLLLPAGVSTEMLLMPMRQRVQNWSKQAIHFLCAGHNWPWAEVQSQDVHFLAHPELPIDYEEFNQMSSVTLQDITRMCHFIAEFHTVPQSWIETLANVDEKMPYDEVVVGVSQLLDMYKYTFLLLDRMQKQKKKKPFADRLANEKNAPVKTLWKKLNMAKPLKTNSCSTHTITAGKNCVPEIVSGNIGDYFTCLAYFILNQINMSESLQNLLSHFTQLHGLSLVQCSITSLTDIATCCPNLVSLLLGDNKITEIPDKFAALKHTLQRLDLSGNPITRLPDFLTEFRQLRKLLLSNTLIRELPADIGDLRSLKKLDLKGNLLSKLPPSFCRLRTLEVLNLQGVPWISGEHSDYIITFTVWMNWGQKILPMTLISDKEREDMFHACDKNKNGSLEGEQIDQLKKKLFKRFPRFGDSGDEEFGGVPEEIFSCVNLRCLFLDYQALRSIPECIKKLHRLRMLFLSHNPLLQGIDGAIGKAPFLINILSTALTLSGCPSLRTPPPEIVNQGMSTVLAYLTRLSQGSVTCHRTKLMFVGLGGAGKTSLMRALMSANHTTSGVVGEGITDGIDISSWTIHKGRQPLTYSVWDFAGQTVYYNTHQFFLSNRAIYLLVWNTRLGYEHSGLNFWLSSIACHCPKAPVLIIGTHADQITKPDLPADILRARYPRIVNFYIVSTTTGQGIKDLMDSLLEVTYLQPYMGEMAPEAWLSFERAILSKRNSVSLLNWNTITEMANTSGVYGAEIKQAVQFLHELGTLQHFDNELLRDRVVINPQWIANVMSCVVSVHNKYIQDGRLLHSDLRHIWKSEPRDLHHWLLRLTETFDLTLALTDKEENLVPCLLPQTEAEYTWPEVGSENGVKETKMIYKFDYLPVGLFNRAQVRLHEFSDSSAMWKNGSLLKKNGHLGLIKQVGETELTVLVHGQRPENILLLIHEVFEGLIGEFFHGVKYEYQLPCRECVQAETTEPSMFSSRVLRRAIEMKAPFLQCHTFFHILSISEVQNTMPPQSSSDYDLQLQTAMHDLQELEDNLSMDVFALYSSKNVDACSNGGAISPKQVIRNLQDSGFTCWYNDDLAAKQTEDVTLAMKNSKLILVFISEEFVYDESCQRMFHFAKDTLSKQFVLLLVGSGMNWLQSDIGMQVAEKVFINFQHAEQYKTKINDLVSQLTTYKENSQLSSADVFISYCWLNSASAVQAGHVKQREGCVGQGDPRLIKNFLAEHGIQCWIDIERTGKVGLFEDIAEGMRQAKVVVACVSDEYVLSRNCQMEFRFAHVALKKPIILAVVGTGFQWESTEIGMLSLGYPKINFQLANSIAHEQLLQNVQNRLRGSDGGDVDRVSTPSTNDQKQSAFQELYELAQRKFLRLISSFVQAHDAYPRLFVPDYANSSTDCSTSDAVKDEENAMEEEEEEEEAVACNNKDIPVPTMVAPSDVANVIAGEMDKSEKADKEADECVYQTFDLNDKFCIKVLCEYEGGWHCASDEGFPVHLSGADLVLLWQLSASYIARILAILKHSNTNLEIVCSEKGARLMKKLEKSTSVDSSADLKAVYKRLRHYMISKDVKQIKGNLSRCHVSSGKTLWLCPMHQQLMQATVLDAASSQQVLDEADIELEMGSAEMLLMDGLRKLHDEIDAGANENEDIIQRAVQNDTGRKKMTTPLSVTSALKKRTQPLSASERVAVMQKISAEHLANTSSMKTSRACCIL